jgi:hypothetical protein
MATRSTIALEFADGTVQQVYSHWDGYLEHNGAILLENYTDPFKLRDLIDLGDISSLGPNIGTKHPFSPHESADAQAEYEAAEKAGATTFYGRDRGETGTEARKFANFEDYKANHQYEEYEYILRQVDGKAVWFVSQYGRAYTPLADALEATKKVAA